MDKVIEVLKPIGHFTKRTERRGAGLQDWVPIVDKLISHFYEASQRFKSLADESATYEWLHICCEVAWEKLNEYYQLADKTPAYYTAMVMDPRKKYDWFKQKWVEPPKCDWVSGVESIVGTHWKQTQKSFTKLPTHRPPPQPERSDESDLDDHIRISYSATGAQASAFVNYTTNDPIEKFKLLDWKAMEKKQPHLVQFAMDHALPISTAECERSFSSAKFTLNPLRTCMKSDLFEALETLRAWYLQDQQDKDRAEKEIRLKEEQEVISQAIGDFC